MKKFDFEKLKASKWLKPLKWILAFLAIYLIYERIHGNNLPLEIWPLWTLVAVIFLSVAGMFLESRMWWLPAQRIGPLSFQSAISNTLIFNYIHLFAPSGLSEFSARLLQFPERLNRKKSVEITALIQACKWISRFFLAALGVLALEESGLSQGIRIWVAIFLFLVGGLALFIILNPQPWHSLLNDRWNHRLLYWLPETLSGKFPVLYVLSLSTLKAFTYSSAFALLLIPIGNFEASAFLDLLLGTWAFYFAASLLPTLGPAEGLVKVGAGLLFFELWHLPEWQIGSAALLMWLLNKAIPGVLGGAYTLVKRYKNHKVLKT